MWGMQIIMCYRNSDPVVSHVNEHVVSTFFFWVKSRCWVNMCSRHFGWLCCQQCLVNIQVEWTILTCLMHWPLDNLNLFSPPSPSRSAHLILWVHVGGNWSCKETYMNQKIICMLQEDPGQEWHGHRHPGATALALQLAIYFFQYASTSSSSRTLFSQ